VMCSPEVLVGVDRAECLVEEFISGLSLLVWWSKSESQWSVYPSHKNCSIGDLRAQCNLDQLPRSWCYSLVLVAGVGMVLKPPNCGRLYVVGAFDTNTWLEIPRAQLDSVCVSLARPLLIEWSQQSLWLLWERCAQLEPSKSRGFVISCPRSKCLVENPNVSSLANLCDADFTIRALNANNKGAIQLLTGERPTRNNLSHELDISLRRAMCFLPCIIDCALQIDLQFVLPSSLNVPDNWKALEGVTRCVGALMRDVDAAFVSLASLDTDEFSVQVSRLYSGGGRRDRGGLSSFLYWLKRCKCDSMRELFAKCDHRAKLHVAVADYLKHWWVNNESG
jgi:hypothetical protein